MAKARPLVGGYLEQISVKAFERYQREITDLVRVQHGVYALYKNDRLYYVGLAVNLRRRINQHLRDKHAGRWNRFSLYLVRKVDHIREIESLLLRISPPAGNKKGGRLRRAANLRKQLRSMMQLRAQKEIDEILRGGAGQPTTRRRPTGGQTTRRKSRRTGRRKKLPLADIGGGKRLYATYKGRDYKAIVRANGQIKLGNQLYDTPSGAAQAVVGRMVNGWSFWRVRHGGEMVRLSALR
jgi:hypothetical protein